MRTTNIRRVRTVQFIGDKKKKTVTKIMPCGLKYRATETAETRPGAAIYICHTKKVLGLLGLNVHAPLHIPPMELEVYSQAVKALSLARLHESTCSSEHAGCMCDMHLTSLASD